MARSFFDDMSSAFTRIIRESRRNIPISLFILGLILMTLLLNVSSGDSPTSLVFLSIPLLIISVSAVVGLYGHLQDVRDTRSDAYASRDFQDIHDIPPSFKEIIHNEITSAVLTNEDRANLLNEVRVHTAQNIASLMAQELETKFSLHTIKARNLETLRVISAQMRNRLETEINALGRRANLNLSIGVFLSVCGLLVLAHYVFFSEHDYPQPENFVYDFVVRLSLVIFIEVFAYFFLKLYRYGIFEIKYFQNEITNADFRVMALDTAVTAGDTTTLDKLCTEISRTERNFLIKKGESTLVMRHEELQERSDKTLVSSLERLFALFKKEQSAGK